MVGGLYFYEGRKGGERDGKGGKGNSYPKVLQGEYNKHCPPCILNTPGFSQLDWFAGCWRWHQRASSTLDGPSRTWNVCRGGWRYGIRRRRHVVEVHDVQGVDSGRWNSQQSRELVQRRDVQTPTDQVPRRHQRLVSYAQTWQTD